jgi:adenylylsulfate kinase
MTADRKTNGGGESRPGAVLWFTGLSGSGKSTIAERVVQELAKKGVPLEYLDGDLIREIFPATGFTRPERDAHIKRVGFLASRLEAHGVVVVASLVSPYESSRQFVRGLCRRFQEIFVSTPFEECERRDVKGLYARARRGEITNFTGLDDPYEPPARPELTIDTRNTSVDEAVKRVLELLEKKTTG